MNTNTLKTYNIWHLSKLLQRTDLIKFSYRRNSKKAVLKSLTCSVIHVYISLFLGRKTIETDTIRCCWQLSKLKYYYTVNYFWLWPSLFLGRIFHWKVLEAQNYFFNQSAEHSNVQITWLERWCSDQIIHAWPSSLAWLLKWIIYREIIILGTNSHLRDTIVRIVLVTPENVNCMQAVFTLDNQAEGARDERLRLEWVLPPLSPAG